MKEEGFVTEGFIEYPNMYVDHNMMVSLGDERLWPNERIERVLEQYRLALETDVLPHHRPKMEEIRDYLIFELAYRDGLYEDTTLKDLDELCEGA